MGRSVVAGGLGFGSRDLAELSDVIRKLKRNHWRILPTPEIGSLSRWYILIDER